GRVIRTPAPAPKAQPAIAAFDQSRLEKLAEFVDEDDLLAIVESFVEEARPILEQPASAWSTRDDQQLRLLGSLRDSLATLGFAADANDCDEALRAPDELATILPKIRRSLELNAARSRAFLLTRASLRKTPWRKSA